jgi:hypothetical protein
MTFLSCTLDGHVGRHWRPQSSARPSAESQSVVVCILGLSSSDLVHCLSKLTPFFSWARPPGSTPRGYTYGKQKEGQSMSCELISSASRHTENKSTPFVVLQPFDSISIPISGLHGALTVNPRYHGVMGTNSWPFSFRLMFSAISRGLYWGTKELHPVPMPSLPFTSTMGRTGTNLAGGRKERNKFAGDWGSS